jgi:hypothetical protein
VAAARRRQQGLAGVARIRHRAQQSQRIGVARAAEDRTDRAVFRDPPGIEHGDAVAALRHHAEVVGHEDHRHAQRLPQSLQQLEDLVLDRHIQRRRRLVRQQQRRV